MQNNVKKEFKKQNKTKKALNGNKTTSKYWTHV